MHVKMHVNQVREAAQLAEQTRRANEASAQEWLDNAVASAHAAACEGSRYLALEMPLDAAPFRDEIVAALKERGFRAKVTENAITDGPRTKYTLTFSGWTP